MHTRAGYVVYSILGLLVYLYVAYCFYGMAKNRKMNRPWFAWIPILNLYLASKMVGRGVVYTILLLIPIVNVIFSAVVAVKLARAYGHRRLYGLLLLIPLVDYFVLWSFAYGSNSEAPLVDMRIKRKKKKAPATNADPAPSST